MPGRFPLLCCRPTLRPRSREKWRGLRARLAMNHEGGGGLCNESIWTAVALGLDRRLEAWGEEKKGKKANQPTNQPTRPLWRGTLSARLPPAVPQCSFRGSHTNTRTKRLVARAPSGRLVSRPLRLAIIGPSSQRSISGDLPAGAEGVVGAEPAFLVDRTGLSTGASSLWCRSKKKKKKKRWRRCMCVCVGVCVGQLILAAASATVIGSVGSSVRSRSPAISSRIARNELKRRLGRSFSCRHGTGRLFDVDRLWTRPESTLGRLLLGSLARRSLPPEKGRGHLRPTCGSATV